MATAQTPAAPAAQSAPAPASAPAPSAAQSNGFIQFFKNNWKKLVIGLIAVVLSITAFIGGMALLDKAKKSAAAKASATPATQQIVSGDQPSASADAGTGATPAPDSTTAPAQPASSEAMAKIGALENQLSELQTMLSELLSKEGGAGQQSEEIGDEAEAPAAQVAVVEASEAPAAAPANAPATTADKIQEAILAIKKDEENFNKRLELQHALKEFEVVRTMAPKHDPKYGSLTGDTLFIAVQKKDGSNVVTPQEITFYMSSPKGTIAYPVSKYLIDGDTSNDPPNYVDALLRPKDFPPINLMPQKREPFSLVGPLADKYQWKLLEQLPVEIQNTVDTVNKVGQPRGWPSDRYCYVLEKRGGGVIDPNDFADEYHMVVGHSSVALPAPPAKK